MCVRMTYIQQVFINIVSYNLLAVVNYLHYAEIKAYNKHFLENYPVKIMADEYV